MEAGIADRVWSIEEIVGLLESLKMSDYKSDQDRLFDTLHECRLRAEAIDREKWREIRAKVNQQIERPQAIVGRRATTPEYRASEIAEMKAHGWIPSDYEDTQFSN